MLVEAFCLQTMHYLYIIYSKKKNQFYTGESDDPHSRLELHNQHYFKKGFTKIADDWELVLVFECRAKEDAVYLEKFVKRMKSRKFIQKIIKNPKNLTEILNKR